MQFVVSGGLAWDFSEGQLTTTGRPLDVAIDGNAFFKVSTPAGERYTKDGRFGVDAQGKLVTASGAAVLDDSGGEITLDSSNGPPTISADGIVSQKSSQGPTGVRVGKIGMVRFDTLSVLSKEGNNLYVNSSNSQPQAAPDVRRCARACWKAPNVNPIAEITSLIEVQRAYEGVATMVQNNNDLSQQSIDRLAKVA